MSTTLRFFYNGIKDGACNAKLQKCHYSKGGMAAKWPRDTITIYARNYKRFSDGIRAAFVVENNSDGMTDYFEEDHIRVTPDHPLYALVNDAWAAQIIKFKLRQARRECARLESLRA